MRTVFFIVLMAFVFTLDAQDLPQFMPEDIESESFEHKCLCSPGVFNKSRSRGLEVSFLHVFPDQLNEEDGFPLNDPLSVLSIQNLIINLRFPIINKEGFKIIGGVVYRPEHFDFKTIGADYKPIFEYINSERIKSNGFEGIITKSLNERHYTVMRLRLLYNGDYSGFIKFDDRYAVYGVSGLFGVKKHDHLEYGFGGVFVHSFRRTTVLPFFLINQTFNDKWGLEAIVPALIRIRRNWSWEAISLLELRYNSRSYAIALDEPNGIQPYNFNHSEVRLALTLERQVHPWVWLEGQIGYQHNFSADFESQVDPRASFQVEPGSSPFFKVGIFVSPPDSFVR